VDAVTALALDGVRFGYGARPVLDGVSLRIGAGEGVALLGANGAGKTTLTRLAMGLRHPDQGRVTTAGRDTASRHPEDLADVAGYLFQHPESQLFARSVRAEVAFGPQQLGWEAGRVAEAVDRVLAELGLEALAGVHPYDLPTPTRRLVALAAALVCGPQLLILDEPTAGLDGGSRRRVSDVILARRAQGTAVLAVTHDLGFAAGTLDRALVLDGGHLAYDGPLPGLLGHDPRFPAPPLLALARRLHLGEVRPTVAALAPLLTSPPVSRTLET
jgi:energy-coupling factor transporter ATP-binding protein EcfA2